MQRDEAAAILRAHREDLRQMGVTAVSIFGSVARNEAEEKSDVDVLVEISRPMGFFAFLDIQFYLEELLGRPVDLGTRDALKPGVYEAVMRDAIRVA